MAAHHKRHQRGPYSRRGRKDNGEREKSGAFSEIFQTFREELDAKYDRHERVVKLSRDCTIESKRMIFLLHRISSESDESRIYSEADEKLKEVLLILRSIALELEGQDPYRHHNAYLHGVQEFIEALSYFVYLKTGKLISYKEVQEYLTFHREEEKKEEEEEEEKLEEKGDESKEEEGGDCEAETKEIVVLFLDPIDYVQGLADLTGELMRMSINAVGSGNRDVPFQILPFVRAIYCGMHSLRPVSYVLRKLHVLRSSLGKIEQTCYTLKIRGSEIPKHMLLHVINASTQVGYSEDTEVYDAD